MHALPGTSSERCRPFVSATARQTRTSLLWLALAAWRFISGRRLFSEASAGRAGDGGA